MDFQDAEDVIRAYIEEQWALTDYASIPLVFENELKAEANVYIVVNIEGIPSGYSSVYGGIGKRFKESDGIIFIHCFGETGNTKRLVTKPILAMTEFLELRVLQKVIDLYGANPPSPVYHGGDEDFLVPNAQPGGQYYRCTASVPFSLRATL